jgi:zinc protease
LICKKEIEMKYMTWRKWCSAGNVRYVGIGLILMLVFPMVQCRSTMPVVSETKTPVLAIHSQWPHQTSDLDSDPDILFGALANGVRYILMENQTPKDRVSMHLCVQAGSLLESEQELGAAHFLEHMMFNGSKHFPPGEMVKFFQRIGMQFGPDANAHTAFDRTVYDVLLPKGDPGSLSEGLLVLRDYADGALLLPEEVERERKVILAEMRSRDSADYRAMKAGFEFEMPDCLVSRRFPIGKKAVLEKMDHQLLRGFYEAWYRPERLFLVIVGDFKSDQVKPLISKHFADLKSKSPARRLPQLGTFSHKGLRAFYHHEDEIGATTISIGTLQPERPPKDSRNWQREQLLRSLSLQMMQKRLDQLLQQPSSVLTSASVGGGYYLQHLKYAEIRTISKPEHWKDSLSLIEQSLRRALQHGFTESELNCAKNQLRSQIIQRIQQAGTRDSKALSRQIINKLSTWQVIQSPQQNGDLLLPMLEASTVDAVNRTFSELWSADHRLILVTGNADLTDQPFTPEALIRNVYSASRTQQVQPYAGLQVASFPYLPDPENTGDIAERVVVNDLGIHRIVFANGVRLYLKPTTFKANQVLAAMSFGGGHLSEPADQPGLAKLTEAVVNESGFGGMDRMALEDALAGRLASTRLTIREGMFVVKGEAAASEIPLLFQLLYTFIKDPGMREDARRLSLKRFEQEHERLLHSTEGMMQLHGHRFLAGGDSRFGTPAWSELQQRTLGQVEQWFGSQLRQMPLELALVGDFDPEAVIALAARYLGSLPKRNSGPVYAKDRRPVFPSGKSLDLAVKTEISKALVVVAYPTDDFWEIKQTRRLAVTADLFSERLRQRIRERLGAAYSPYAYNHCSRSYPGYGLLKIIIQLDPKQVSNIIQEVRYIADQMVDQHADADEFRRILDPTLTQIKDFRQTNAYWLNNVLTGASRHPEQLDWSRSFASDYAAITAAEVNAVARQYLDNTKAATVVFMPEDKKNDG